MTRSARVVLAAGRGHPAAPAHRDRAQGAVPGRQRAAARPGAGPAGRGTACSGPAGSRSTPATWPTRSPTHVGGRAHLSVEPGPPALGTAGRARPTCGTGSPAGRVLVGNADAYLAPRGAAGARPRRRCCTAGTARRYGCSACRRPIGRAGRVRRPALRRVLAAARPTGRGRPAGRPGRAGARRSWRPAERAGRLEVITLRRRLPRHRHARPTSWRPTCTRPAAASLVAAGRGGPGTVEPVGGRRRGAGSWASLTRSRRLPGRRTWARTSTWSTRSGSAGRHRDRRPVRVDWDRGSSRHSRRRAP